MKNFKKLLVLICVLTFLVAGVAVAAFAENENLGTVEELDELVTAAENANDVADKHAAVLDVAEYLNTKTIDPYEDNYEDTIARAYAVAIEGANAYIDLFDSDEITGDTATSYILAAHEILEAFDFDEDTSGLYQAQVRFDEALAKTLGILILDVDSDIENTKATAKNQIAINRVERVYSVCSPYDKDVLEDFNTEYDALLKAHKAVLEANYKAIDETNYITNYDQPIYFEENWESYTAMDTSAIKKSWSVAVKEGSTSKLILQKEANGNKYYTHLCGDLIDTGSSYIQVSLGDKGKFMNFTSEYGFVIELDITTFDTFPEGGFQIEMGSIGGDSKRYPAPYLYINSNGDICLNNKTTAILEGAMVPGQWLNVKIAFDYDDFVYNVIVAGEVICTYDATYNGTTFDHKDVAMRFSTGSASSTGSVAIDNIRVYGGNNYRDHNKLNKMSDNDKFVFYTEYFLSEDNKVTERCEAYSRAQVLLSKYWEVDEATGEGKYTEIAKNNPKIKKALEEYLAFNLDAFLAEVKLANLKIYVDYITKLEAIERKPDTVSERQIAIATIEKFIEKNIDLTDRDADLNENLNPDYIEYNIIYQKVIRETDYDSNAPAFIRLMERFSLSEIVSAKQRNYDKAKAILLSGVIDIDLLRSEDHPARANFEDLVKAYETYINADKEIFELSKGNNSAKIVYCMDLIDEYQTEAQWLENEEYITHYIFLIKNIVLGTDDYGDLLYDENAKGVTEAVQFFNKVYGFFYARMQNDHIVYIQSVLDLILETDQYIEKMGMLTLLDNYIVEKEVDVTNPNIAKLVEDIDTCKAELEIRKEDYANVLRQNAVYFTNFVERMRTAQTYNEKKMYFDQASVLYLKLDATVGNTAEALVIFDEYKNILAEAEAGSEAFLQAVLLYQASETEDDKYAALVECYYSAQYADITYDGVEEAMAVYTAAYDAYMDYAESVNKDVSVVGNAVGSFRVNTGIINVISMFIEMVFGK